MSHYQVAFKKVFTGVVGKDEGEALDRACRMLGAGMVSEQGLVDYFESAVQKEPVKEITITEDGIKEFLEGQFVGKELTEQEIKDFMDFLEADVTEWLKQNLRCFMED